MGKPIYQSTWGTIQRKWNDLLSHQWQDFALVIYEIETQLSAQGIQIERGNISLLEDTIFTAQGISIEKPSSALIFQSDTEMLVAIFVSTINFYEMLLYFLPWYDKINLTFQNLCRVLDISFRYLEEQTARVERNLDLDRAIELLPYFEKRLGIEINSNLSYEQRRNQIRAVIHGMHNQVTEEAVKELVSAFSANHSGVEVIRTQTPFLFEIRFMKNGLPNNMNELDRILKNIFPSDLAWKYTYTQSPWESVVKKKYRWGDVVKMSWKEINQYKEG